MTLGKAVAGLIAQSKGRRLGIYEEKTEEEKEAEREKERDKEGSLDIEYLDLLGRSVPAIRTPHGLRAAVKGDEVQAASVDKYLRQKFKDGLDDARTAMEKLANAYSPR